jgi:hypothetical protein
MSIAVTTPITGAAQTGLTAPTYTVVLDTYPDVNGKQNAVTALGGTQTGGRVHAVSDPFTVAFTRPKAPKALQSVNPITGKYGSIPKNTYSCVIRKGVNFAANNAPEILLIRMYIDVPAGADAYDSVNVRAALSCAIGALTQQSAGLGDMLVNGVI